MKLKIVEFETAKLANEKGFKHMKSNCFGDNMSYDKHEELKCSNLANTVVGYILAPTQELLRKWLRDVHDIDIVIKRYFNNYGISCITKYDKDDEHNLPIDLYGLNFKDYDTYEEALEGALIEALNSIT